MKILFCGYYGKRNAGDDAFNAVSVWGARRYWGVEDCALLSPTVPRLPFRAASALPARSRFRGHRHLCAILQSAARGQIVYAGGSTLHTRPGPRDYSFYHALLSRARRCRLAGIGLSIGPFKSDRDRDGVKAFLDRFSFLGLRDKRSVAVAAELRVKAEVRETFDLAALLPRLCGGRKAARAAPTVGVSLCRYESLVGGDPRVEAARMERICATLVRLGRARPDVRIRFYAFNADPELGDEGVTREMRARLGAELGGRCELRVYDGDPLALWRDVAGCRALIGTRLHSAVFAYTAGVPFLLAEYHPKCGDFLETIGYPASLRVPAAFIDPDDAASAVDRLLRMSGVLDVVALAPEAAAERATLNFTQCGLWPHPSSGGGRCARRSP